MDVKNDLISVLIVDDEPYSREYIRELVERDFRFEVVGESGCANSGIRNFSESRPDVIFLDIEMPGLGGFELVKSIKKNLPIVVVVSAFSKYAVQAFDFAIFDYLTKPVDTDRFAKTIERVAKRFFERQLLDTVGRSETSSSRVLNTVNGQLICRDSEIQHFECAGNYVKIKLASESHLVRDTLVNLFEDFCSPEFVRVHRSFVVNMQHIRKLTTCRSGQAKLLMRNGDTVPVSRSRRKEVTLWLETNSV